MPDPESRAIVGPRSLRVLLFAGILLCGVNIFTGGPLLAVWAGSIVQNERPGLSSEAVVVVGLVLVVLELGLTRALSVLTSRYDESRGYRHGRRRAAWLRSQSDERRGELAVRSQSLSPSERILAGMVVTAVVVLEVVLFSSHYNLSAPTSALGFVF